MPATSDSDRKPKREVTTRTTSFIAPERLYTREGFMRAAGISRTRLSDARHDHKLWPKFFDVGQRQFIHGTDAIAFIVALSAAESGAK